MGEELAIGIMCQAMVQRLMDRSRAVTVWNREPERLATVLPHGAREAASPADVAETSDVVMLCVLNTAAIEACGFGPHGVVRATTPPKLLIDLSTVDPAATERMAARLFEERGIAWINAPVSGGPRKARDGTLAIMVGGAEPALALARPILADLGTVTVMGGIGAGQRTKIVNQAIVGSGYVLMAEALALAEAAGIAAERLPECLADGLADGALLQLTFRQMQARDFKQPLAYARQLMKDFVAVCAFGHERALSLPVLKAAVNAYERFTNAGNKMRDSAAIALAYVGGPA